MVCQGPKDRAYWTTSDASPDVSDWATPKAKNTIKAPTIQSVVENIDSH